MKLLRLVLALAFELIVKLTRAQATGGSGRPSALGVGVTRFAAEGVVDVGVTQVHAIAHEDEQTGQGLIDKLEADGHVTVVRQVEVGELLCGSLKDAPDSTLLRFAISSTETLIAERTSYESIDGSVMTDGNERKVWMGNVVDPEPVHPRTVSMTWADPCELESFHLKVESDNTDGSTTITESIPCEAGSSTELCFVELSVVFDDEDLMDPIEVEEQVIVPRLNNNESIQAGVFPGRDGGAAITPSGRRLQGTTRIDLMVLYDKKAWNSDGYDYTEPVLLTKIVESIQETNQAMKNSEVDLKLALVHVGRLPYAVTSIYAGEELGPFRVNSDVVALRNLHRADLVMLVGWLLQPCGVAYTGTNQAFGFSAIGAHCFAVKVQSHELGHNFGCLHHRPQATDPQSGYRHGFAQCTGDVKFSTIMATASGCPPLINHFSNPDVKYEETIPTGDKDTANNAQRIRDRMGPISHYRDPCVQPGNTCTQDYECCGDQCLEGICVDDCFNPKSAGYRCTYGGSTTLDLRFCAMTYSDALKSLRGCFTTFGLTNIEWLRLDNNELSTLRAGVFSGLGSLTRLTLNSNQLTVLPRELFDGLGSLTRLDLNNNNLTTLPDGATLGDGILGGLRSLEVLDLHNNDLAGLPLRILHGLVSLTTLNLRGNQLPCLPMMSRSVTNLMVDGSVKGYYCADVNGCLQPGGSNYRCIRGRRSSTLNLASCGITDSDASGGLLQSCFNIFGPTNIQLLKLENNKLSTLRAGVFDGLGSLTRLVLSANKLTALPSGLFSGLGSLTRLDLNNNALTGGRKGVPDAVFDDLRSLTVLDLHNNELVALVVGVFDGLVSLTVLNLQGNQLPCLPTVPRSVTKLLVDGSVKGNYCDPGRTCDNGIVGVQGRIGDGREACCPLTCLNGNGEPQCGNGDCYNRPGGATNCCVGNIFNAREDCNDTGEAPCFIST